MARCEQPAGQSGNSRLDLESNVLPVGPTPGKKRGQDLDGQRGRPWNLGTVARECTTLWWSLPQSYLELLFEDPQLLEDLRDLSHASAHSRL